MNTFLATASLTPIPVFDGGPVLKWSLVARGKTLEEAETIVRKANGFASGIFAAASAVAFKRRKWFIGALLVQFAFLALSFALGWIKERD